MSNPLAVAPQKTSALTNIEGQRAIQEVQAALVIAKRFPRDEKLAIDRITNACCRPGLAEVSAYSYSRGGTDISGPSIRLMEAIAGYWGNIEFGFREIGRTLDEKGVGISEVEAYAWDVESNTRRPARFTVRHWRDTRNGGYAITEERDIYELVANMAQRRVRACLQAVIPGDVVEIAQKQCDVTMKAKADTTPEGQKKLLESFEQYGVTKDQIEKRIGRRIDAITAAQVVGLKKVWSSLRDGMSAPKDWFDQESAETGVQGENPLAAARQPEAKPEPIQTPDAKQMWYVRVEELCCEEGITMLQFEKAAAKVGEISATQTLKNAKASVLEKLHANFRNIIATAEQGGAGE